MMEHKDRFVGTGGIYDSVNLFIRIDEVESDAPHQGAKIVGKPAFVRNQTARDAYRMVNDEARWNEFMAFTANPGPGVVGVYNIVLRYRGFAYQSLETVQVIVRADDVEEMKKELYCPEWFEQLKSITVDFTQRWTAADGRVVALRVR